MIRQSSNGAGNFVSQFTQRLYLEHFTAANVRLHFKGGSKYKQPLSLRRKSSIRSYVFRYFPTMSNDSNNGNEYVTKIN
ncbi:hypothetical protein DPMN_111731 [Dreissena polymorpha]|uniref:Uncharacterized protein n=1 Tax=Dreissena polymorpha TaxID=45954 RepID=A0A9D4KF17_DREPO|nr:hypothetical protein DPMN_111731 [Dreissena polymorpha]